MSTRSPICTVVGHVDHGKSSILDWIRDTSIVKGEAGAITQAIGASKVSLDIIKQKTGKLLDALKIDFTIPGLLFIDTPGHAAFTNLRKRGGNLADIAIVVIDINEGFMPQTIEAIEILKSYKTPFIIAANKVDLIPGWQKKEGLLLQSVQAQHENVQKAFETKMYELVGKIFDNFQIEAERFDRVSDYTKQIAIVPCSAETGEGLPELLMTVTGLAQRYLADKLEISEGNGKGIVLEVKDVKGLGKTLDLILYNGTIKVNDNLVIGGLDQPIVTKVKAIFSPSSVGELRDKKTKFDSVKDATAAAALRISANEIEDVVSGMPVLTAEDIEAAKIEVQKEIEEVTLQKDEEGIVVKADSLGSLEAMITLLKEKNIPVVSASIGNISKKDVASAEASAEKDPQYGVILGFNVEAEISSDKIKIITNPVIYRLITDLEKWKLGQQKELEERELDVLVRPCKIKLLKNYIFRQSNPAVVGAEVLSGKLKTGTPLMLKGKKITVVKSLQVEKESVSELLEGKQGAVSMDGITIGRNLEGDETLYSAVPEKDFKKMKEFKKALGEKEILLLKEIARIMREDNPVWGI